MKPFLSMILPFLLIAAGCDSADGEDWVPVYEEPRHRRVLDNDAVMILDVNLPPGYVSLYHRHELDVLYVTVSGTRVWAQPLGGERRDADVPTGDLRFSSDNHELPHIHRVGNAGTAPFHIIGVGFKRPGAADTGLLSGDMAGMEKVAEKNNVSVYRIRLEPGERSGEHRHDSTFVRVMRTGGRLRESDGPIESLDAGAFRWETGETRHSYENAGTDAIEIVEVLAR